MIALKSEIQLDNFVVLQSHYGFSPPQKIPKDINKLFRSYQIDIDFVHQEKDERKIQVFTKISVNQSGNPIPGYQLFVEGTAQFSFNETNELAGVEKINLKFFSTVSILIGNLRNTLTAMTASAPLGPYQLPLINITDLFNKKAENK